MKISALFPKEDFAAAVRDGDITVRYHPEFPLAIANYSKATQWTRKWNPVTTQCRGLIYNTDTDDIVSRPFPKFGNWNEPGFPEPKKFESCIRMPKFDGCLGVMYTWEGQNFIASRGSFESFASDAGNNILSRVIDIRPDEGKTYLFEIIHPTTKIVIDYGGREELVLISVIDNATGEFDAREFRTFGWPWKATREFVSFTPNMQHTIAPGEEGYVFISQERPVMFKMKSPEYIELHRIVTGLNEVSVWSMMMEGKSLDDILVDIQEEMHPWVSNVHAEISLKALAMETQARTLYGSAMSCLEHPGDRKTFAQNVVGSPLASLAFMLYDGHDIAQATIKMSRPRVEKS